MPDAVDTRILLDSYHIALLALVMGLVTFGFIRSSNPVLRWHEHGNVWTQPFGWMELVITLVLIALFYAPLQVMAESAAATGVVPVDEPPPPEEEAESLSFESKMKMVLGGAVFMGLMAGALLAFLAVVRQLNLFELLGLKRLKPRWLVLWSVGGAVAGIILAMLAFAAWNVLFERAFEKDRVEQEAITMLRETGSILLKVAIAISAVVVAPVAEEIIFRGFMYPAVKRFSDRFFAAIVTSLIFAVIHLNAAIILPLFVLAMVMTIAYELTGCLLVPIGIHALFNLFQTVMVFLGFS